MKKDLKTTILIVLGIILIVPLVCAISGTSTSYNLYSKTSSLVYNSSGTTYSSRGGNDQIVGQFSMASSYSGRLGLNPGPNTAPPAPTNLLPLNSSQQVYNNLTFEWTSVTDPDGDSVTYDINFTNSNFEEVGYVSGINTTTHTNDSLPDGWTYWSVRSFDTRDYSVNKSDEFKVDNVIARIGISPSSSTVKQSGQSQTITISQDFRSDWLTNFTLIITGDGQDLSYDLTNDTDSPDTGTWSYTYTVPAGLNPTLISVNAYGWNNTLAENVTNSTSILVTRPVGGSVSTPRITSFYPNVTNVQNGDDVTIVLDVDLDVLNKTASTSYSKDGAASVALDETSFSDNNNFDYNFNYTFTPNGTGVYNATTTITDTNDNTNASSFLFYVSTASSIDLTATGCSNINIKDIQSGISLVSNASVNQSFVLGEYNVEVTMPVGVVTLYNATPNESSLTVLDYADKDESVSIPSNTLGIDRFSMSSQQPFSNNAVLVYDYTNVSSRVITESNLKVYKCDSEENCTWSAVGQVVDTSANTVTATFSSFSIFLIAEDIATLTATSPSGGGTGGGLSVQSNSIKIITPAALSANPLKMLLQDSISVPLRIQNNGNKALTGIIISSTIDNPLIKLRLDKTTIPRLEAGASEIVMATVTSNLTEPGLHSIKVVASSTSPAVSDESEIIIVGIIAPEEKENQITTRVIFAKDLFKEHPECLELQELLDRADQAIQNKDYEKARTLTETAILGCEDMITAMSAKKEIEKRLPFTKQQMIILMVIGSSVMTLIVVMLISAKTRKAVKEKAIKVKSKYKVFKILEKREEEHVPKKNIWKR